MDIACCLLCMREPVSDGDLWVCRGAGGEGGARLSLAQGLVSSTQQAMGSLHHHSMESCEEGSKSEGEGIGRMGRLLVAGREEAHKLATSSLLVSCFNI
jgi:hypothetical protein